MESPTRPTTLIEDGFLWMGGGVFVGSLGLAVYEFGVAWPAAAPLAPERVAAAVAVNAALFTAFALHHSLLAREHVKAWMTRTLPVRLLRSVYVWTASLLFGMTLLGWQPIGHVIYQVPAWLSPLLYATQAAGLMLIAGAARIIDALELAGIRSATKDRLAIRGPYRLVRHPLYLGWLLVVWGSPLLTGDRLTFAALSSAYLFLAMPWEEQSMALALGGDYERYRSIVRWRIVPGLY